jgi:hypothetical protein
LAELKSQFHLPVFDLPTAAYAANLFQQVHQVPKTADVTRACVKADVMIVATAKIAGAREFYSHEPRVRHYAELAGMIAKDLPAQAKNLWTEEEMKLPPSPKKPK